LEEAHCESLPVDKDGSARINYIESAIVYRLSPPAMWPGPENIC
jgi:hypothetical protein